MKHKCPICKKPVKAPPHGEAEEAKYFPFCSKRCRLIDLGAWFDGEYKVVSKLPDTPQDDDIEE
jgi:hypothetical protein